MSFVQRYGVSRNPAIWATCQTSSLRLARRAHREARLDTGISRKRASMKLLVVIVSYRVTDLTIDCLRSLSGEIGRVPGAKVAVCENGTGPEDARRLREAIAVNGWSDWATLTALETNLGFT